MRPSFLWNLVGSLLPLLLVGAGAAVAQQPVACTGLQAFWCGAVGPPDAGPLVVDAGAPACSACTLNYRSFGRLESAPGRVITPRSRVAIDKYYRTFVVTEPGPRIAVYDDRGAFERFLPWQPSGPGRTVRDIEVVLGPRGAVHVREGNVATMIEPAIRDWPEVRLPPGYGSFTATPADLYLAVPEPSAEEQRGSIAAVGRAGTNYTFGNVLARSAADCVVDCMELILADAYDFFKGGVFLAVSYRYELSVFDGWGLEETQTVRFEGSPWLSSGRGADDATARTLPRGPRIVDLGYEGRGGRLWIIGRTAAADPPAAGGAPASRVADVWEIRRPPPGQRDVRIAAARLLVRASVRDDMELLLPYFGITRERSPDDGVAIELFEIFVSAPR